MTQTESFPNRHVAVYGALRSGTTLLRLMLDAHSQLACPGETDFLFDHLRGSDPSTPYDRNVLERSRIYRAHRDMYADQPLSELTPTAFVNRIAGPNKIAVLMLHRHISRALALFPDLRIVHLLRDPRDVARSSIGMGWAGNVYYGIDHWLDTEADWTNVSPQVPHENVLTVHYENLISEPEATLRAMCSFLNVDYEPAMLEYDKTSTYSKPSKELTFQWKHKQSQREIALVENKIGKLLTDRGYEPSGVVPHAPSVLEKASLKFDNKRAQWTRRVRRYGIVDPLIIALARRLNAPELSAAAQRRLDDITIKHLK